MSSSLGSKAAANSSWPAGSPWWAAAWFSSPPLSARSSSIRPSIVAVAVAAVLGGIVAVGSNRSTAIEAAHELTAAEAKRTLLIEQIDLRLVSNRDGLQ